MDDLVIERVLRCVELVPAGRVASYGTIGEVCGVGPRQVGTIMRVAGSGVAWWRVTSHAGELPAELLARALPHWRDESIAVRSNGRGCRYADYAVDLDALRLAWSRAVADLPPATA